MKTKLKKHALEGTCSREVVGGLSWAEGILQRIFIFKGGDYGKEKSICSQFY